MKFLAALALLILAVADATHVSEHTLRGPRFKAGRQYTYDVELNVTAGVLGLSSQVSAAVLRAEVSIYTKNERDHVLKIDNVYTSGSVKAIDSKYGDIDLSNNRELQDKLNQPIKFTLQNGKVESYTLSEKENLESKKIKKSILRSLEMHVPESALRELDETNIPVTYNTTETTEYGEHSTRYTIMVSPDVEFPREQAVYNISRIDNFESERYPSYKLNQNFQKQGCAEVCREERRSNNKYGAGCPVGHEPHQSPIKTSFSHQQDLSVHEDVISPEVITTVEVHYAKMYDQDMEVLIRYQLTRKDVSSEHIQEPSGQKTYSDLQDMESEINENEIAEHCSYGETSSEAVQASDRLLKSIAETIVNNKLEEPKSQIIGEKTILLKEAMTKLGQADFRTLEQQIKTLSNVKFASDAEKVKRQLWLDILPLVGTSESVKYIVEYITRGIPSRSLLAWEAKEILEALPQNIEEPDEDSVRELLKLTQNTQLLKNSPLLHSAAHLAMAKVAGSACGDIPTIRNRQEDRPSSSWFSSFQRSPKSKQTQQQATSCPEQLLSETVEEISKKLRETQKPAEIAVYIETLSHMAASEALPVLSEYVYGTAENIQEFGPRFIAFTKSMTQHALHNMAGKYPEEVLEIVMPVYFNETESPKVRNAAFGVLIRSQPTLDILQKVAIRSWSEKSKEVGSFVTSTLETFGNSSLPCMQPLTHRIRSVMPHLKRFDTGVQHAQNYMWSYFDEQRDLGLEGRLEYTPSNESLIPSTWYKSLSYSIDSLKDVIFQSSLNIEGLTQEKIRERINQILNIESPETIQSEDEVFGRGDSGLSHLQPRTVDDLRFTTYTKMFYKSSYYYFDSSSLRSAWQDASEYLSAYLKKAEGKYNGYLVKLMLPSSYQTVAIAKTLPYPVKFQMNQPMILSLRIKTPDNAVSRPSITNFNMNIQPSLYMAKLYTHQMKNLGDCKEVGVYHENKIAVTYPFEIKIDARSFPNVTIKYRVPPKSREILRYHSAAGTFAERQDLKSSPSEDKREEIRTIPQPFKFARKMNLVGVPTMQVELQTEDMTILAAKYPRTPVEALDLVAKKILNAGWRHRSISVKIVEDQRSWTRDTEATFNIEYSRQHVPMSTTSNSPQDQDQDQDQDQEQGQPPWGTQQRKRQDQRHRQPYPHWRQSNDQQEEQDWSKYLRPVHYTTDTVGSVAENAKTLARILTRENPHISHIWNVSLTTEPQDATAYIRLELNHTYDRSLYALHAEAVARRSENEPSHEFSLDHLIGFWNKPDEFEYDSKYGKQQGAFLTAISMPRGQQISQWEQMQVAMRGELSYESNEKILKERLAGRVDKKYFLPETHEQCQKDVRDGKPLSVDCVKAIREHSIYNKLNMHIVWDQDLPDTLRQWARQIEMYLKQHFYEHLQQESSKNAPKKVQIKFNYIDKLVDEPAFELEFKKPSETFAFRRMRVEHGGVLSSVYGIRDSAFLAWTNNTYLPTCAMMENYVRTYDLRTFEFKPRDCHYVLSTHCTEKKNFAVIVHGRKEIFVHLGSNTVVLQSESGNQYKVKYNGEEQTISEPVVFDEEQEIYAYTQRYSSEHQHIKLVAKKAGINVEYDGKSIKVQANRRYKGELCGLCSEFDGEEVREFRGLDRCLYRDPTDFANSNMVKRDGSCKVERLRDQKICDEGQESSSWQPERPRNRNTNEPSIERNAVVTKGNEVCFSVKPLPACEDNARPRRTERQRVGFHCLPQNDVTARKLMNEAKWRPLEEVQRKSVDHIQSIEVAKMC